MSVQITSLAIPAKVRPAGFQKRGSKYPLADLRPGTEDCILLDGIDAKKDHSKLSSAVVNYRKAGGVGVFTIRTVTVTEDGVQKTKVGVWRLADKVAEPAAE